MQIKTLLSILLWLSIVLNTAAQTPQLEKRQILEGRVELLVPASFKSMDKEMLALKYAGVKPPQEVFTDERGATNVAFNWTPSKAIQQDLPTLEKVFHGSMQSRQPEATWYGHGLETIGGRQVGYLEMLTPGLDTKIYNLLFYTDVEGRLLLITFNCVEKDMAAWKSTAHQIMQSVRVIKQ